MPQTNIHGRLKARPSFLVVELSRERASLGYIKTLTSPRARAGENIVALVIAQLEAEQVWLGALLADERLAVWFNRQRERRAVSK